MDFLIQLIQQAPRKILVMLALGGMGITDEEQDNPHSAVKQLQISREAAVYRQVSQCLFIWGESDCPC